MNESAVADYITSTFDGVETQTNMGYTFFFYRSDHMLGFATIASTGNEYESISDLDRPGVYRLNIGVIPGAATSRRREIVLHLHDAIH